jgi:hypothetical protein
VAKTGTIKGPLVAFLRGAILPHFGKRGNNWVYSPHEPKKEIIRGFPVLARIMEGKKEPV